MCISTRVTCDLCAPRAGDCERTREKFGWGADDGRQILGDMRRRARRFGELAARAVPGGSGWASQHASGTHFALIEVPSHVLTVSSQMWWWVLTDRARARARDHARLRACVHGWVVCLRLVEFESRRQAALVATGRAPPCVVLQFFNHIYYTQSGVPPRGAPFRAIDLGGVALRPPRPRYERIFTQKHTACQWAPSSQ